MRNPATVPQWRNERFIEFVVAEVFFFIEQTFLFSRLVNCATARSERGKEAVGRSALSRIQILVSVCFAKSPARLASQFATEANARLPIEEAQSAMTK